MDKSKRKPLAFSAGEVFGHWVVLETTPILQGGKAGGKGKYNHWRCRCSCGEERYVSGSNLKNGVSTNCGCIRWKEPAHNYLGVGKLSMKYFSRLKAGAEQRGLSFVLNIQEVHDLFTGTCSLSGLPITLERNTEQQSASLDRIDSTKGYSLDNVQWVHKHINVMKRDFDNDYFIDMCKKVAANSAGGACEVL